MDGFTDAEEAIAGTNAGDSNSYWRVSGVGGAGGASITFDSVVGRDYAIDRNDALIPDPQVWTELTNGIPGTDSPITIDDLDEATNRNYRVRVMLAP